MTPVYKLSASSITGRTTYGSMLAGNPAFVPSIIVEYLVVAGGGGGASRWGGGGGAGGFRTNTGAFAFGSSYTVTVGGGGAGGSSAAYNKGTNGINSVFATITSTGGGGGGTGNSQTPLTGGSGGGGGFYNQNGAAGNAGGYSPVEGYAGGNTPALSYQGAGGGGASASGVNATNQKEGGAGGAGSASSITGSSVTYAGGGGGGGEKAGIGGGAGGAGGGGRGGNINESGVAGTVNTGGGGGGGANDANAGGSGGSGVVVLRWLTSAGTITVGAGLTADATGVVSSNTGSGTDIEVFVGGVGIDYVTSSPSLGQWTISSITDTGGTDITPGTPTTSGTGPVVASVPDHTFSSVNALDDQEAITYNITVPQGSGKADLTAQAIQTFSLAKAGVDGETVVGPTGPTGGAGATGKRTIQGYLYYEKTTANAPDEPSGNTYTFSTGLVSGTGINDAGTTNVWRNSPRTQDPTSSNTHWTVRYYGTEATAGDTTISVNYSGVVQYTNFDGVVTFSNGTFSSGTTALNVPGSSTTSIDGGNITTGSIITSAMQIGQIGQTDSRMLLLDDSLKIFEGTTLRVHLGRLDNNTT